MSMNRRCNVAEIEDAMNITQRAMKRIFDIMASSIGLIVCSPVFLAVAIALKWKEKGSIIFKQERIGYGGEPFYIYKFRTMRIDAEVQGPQLACKEDDRLTRTGKFLREHHLDELPQLWNVLKGDMSMVGPRPERQYFINHETRFQVYLHFQDETWRDFRSHTLQWLHRYHGKDVRPPEHGSQLPANTLPLGRFRHTSQNRIFHY